MFKEFIEILFNVCYIVCVIFKGLDFYYGIKGLKKVVYEIFVVSKIVFLFFSFFGNNNGILIEDG